MSAIFLMLIVQHARTSTRDGADARAFAASRQCSDSRTARGADADALGAIHVTAMPDRPDSGALSGPRTRSRSRGGVCASMPHCGGFSIHSSATEHSGA